MKNTKKLIIAIIAFLVLVAGITALVFFLNTDSETIEEKKKSNQKIAIEVETEIVNNEYVPSEETTETSENKDSKNNKVVENKTNSKNNNNNGSADIKTESDDLEIMTNPDYGTSSNNKSTKATEKKSNKGKSTKATDKNSNKEKTTKATENNNSDKENKNTEETTEQRIDLPFVPAQ